MNEKAKNETSQEALERLQKEFKEAVANKDYEKAADLMEEHRRVSNIL